MGTAGRLVVAGVGALLGNMLFPGKGGQIGFALGSVLGALLFPKKRDYGPERIANLQFQTTAKGTPLQVPYGRVRIAGNIIWIGNFRTIRDAGGKGGKGGSGGKGGDEDVRYTASFAVALCEGTIDAVHRIWSNKTLVDLARYGSQIAIYKGTETQVADPTISAATQGVGAIQPVRQDSRVINGAAPSISLTFAPILVSSEQVFYYDSSAVVGGARNRILLVRVASAPVQNQYTIDYDTGRITFGGSYTNITIFVTYKQSLIGVTDAVGYRHIAYVVFKDWDLGRTTSVPNFTFEITRRPRILQDDSIGLITSSTNIDRRVPETGVLLTSYNPGGNAGFFTGKHRYIVAMIAGPNILEVRDSVTGAVVSTVAAFGGGERVLEVRPSGVVTGAPSTPANTKFRVYSWTGVNNDTLVFSWAVDIGDGFWNNGYDADLDEKFVYLVAGPNRRLWIYARDADTSGNPIKIRGPLFINRTSVDAVGLTETSEMISGITLESGLLYVYWLLNTGADGSNGEIRVYDMSGRTTDTPGLLKFGAAIAIGGATSNVLPLLDTWTGLQSFAVSLGADPPIPQMTIIIAGDFLYVNKQNAAKTLVKCFKLSDKTLKWSQTGGDFLGLIWGTNGAKSSSAEGDQNLAWIAYDALTNTRYGAGIKKTKIDMVSFSEASVHFVKHKLLISPVFKDRAVLLQHVEGILILVDCFLYFSEGKFKLKVRKQETAPRALMTGAYTLGDVSVSREGASDIVKRVLVHYMNRANEYTPETAEAKDDWLVGRREGSELEIGGEAITNPAHARKLAYRILWTRSYKRMAAHIPMGPQDGDIDPSDVVAWTDEDLNLAAKKMRVVGISEEDDGRMGVDVVEENDNVLDWHEYPQAEFAVPVVPQPQTQATHTYLDIMELPPIPVNGNPALVMIVAGVDRAWSGARLYASNDNVSYTRIAEVTQGTVYGATKTMLPATASQFEDTVNTVDVEVLTPDATLLTVTDAQWRIGVNKILIRSEIIYFKTATLVSGQRYTLSGLLRGMELTTAAAHVVEETAVLLNQYVVVVNPIRGTLPRLGLQPIRSMAIDWQLVGRTLYFKAASINVMGEEQSLADVQPVTIVYRGTGGFPGTVNNLRFEQNLRRQGALSFTDLFDRANNNSLGSPWLEDGNSGCRIVSSQLRTDAVDGAAELVRYNAAFSPDHSSKATLVTRVANNRSGIGVRLSGSAPTITGYVAVVLTHTANELQLVKCISQDLATGTVLATAALPASGQLVEIRALGTTISVYVDNVQVISVVDAAVASGLPGFATYNTGSGAEHTWDTWIGADVAVTVAFPMGTDVVNPKPITVRPTPDRDIAMIWGYTDPTIFEDSELENAGVPAKWAGFSHYRVEVFNGATLKRVMDVTVERFVYTELMNTTDNGSFLTTPTFKVYAVGVDGGVSVVQTIQATAIAGPAGY